MSAEGTEIAAAMDRFPKKTRTRLRDAILRLVVVYHRQAGAQLALFPKAQREGNVIRPSCWAAKGRRTRKSAPRALP